MDGAVPAFAAADPRCDQPKVHPLATALPRARGNRAHPCGPAEPMPPAVQAERPVRYWRAVDLVDLGQDELAQSASERNPPMQDAPRAAVSADRASDAAGRARWQSSVDFALVAAALERRAGRDRRDSGRFRRARIPTGNLQPAWDSPRTGGPRRASLAAVPETDQSGPGMTPLWSPIVTAWAAE